MFTLELKHPYYFRAPVALEKSTLVFTLLLVRLPYFVAMSQANKGG